MTASRGIDIEVIQIGEPTCGKPVGFYPTDNCGTTYFTVQFRGVNAKGFGDNSDGFIPIEGATKEGSNVPGCRVADDFNHALGGETTSAHIPESRDGTVYKPPWLTNRIFRE